MTNPIYTPILRKNLARELTWDEGDNNFKNIADVANAASQSLNTAIVSTSFYAKPPWLTQIDAAIIDGVLPMAKGGTGLSSPGATGNVLTSDGINWVSAPQVPIGGGASLYTWMKYADSPTSGMSDDPTGKKYVGFAYNKLYSVPSVIYTDYAWSVIKGDSAALFGIDNASAIFTKNLSGVINPTTGLTLTTSYQNITGSISYQWRKNGTIIPTATNAYYTVPTTDYSSTILSNNYQCTITGTINGVSGSLVDTMTVPLLVDGSNAPTVLLSNQAIIFAAPNTGYSGIIFSGGQCNVTAFLGLTQLSYATTGENTFSCTVSATNVTATAAQNGTFGFLVSSPTAMTADNAYIDVTTNIINGDGTSLPAITQRISYSLSRAGAVGQTGATGSGTPGVDSTIYYIDESAPVISKSSSSALADGTYSSVTFTGTKVVGSVKTPNTGLYLTITANGDTEAITATQSPVTLSPANNAGKSSYTVKMYNQATVAGAVLLDTQTIQVVFTGADGLTLVLSNDSQTIPCDAAGNNGIYTGSGTKIYVYDGATALDYDGVGTAIGKFAITPTSTGISNGSISDGGDYALVSDASAMTSNTAKIDYVITGRRLNGTLFTTLKTQTFSKSKTGGDSTSFWLTCTNALKRSTSLIYTPTFATISGYSQSGIASPDLYACRFKVYESGSSTASYTSATDESSINYTPSGTSVSQIKVEMYLAGGTVTKIDEQVIAILADGSSSLSIINSNGAVLLPSDASGNVGNYSNSGTTLQVYEGSTALTFTTGTAANGQWSLATSQNPTSTITLGAISGNGTTTATIANHSAMVTGTDKVSITYAITAKKSDGTTLSLTDSQSIAKAKVGATSTTPGPTGTRGGGQFYGSASSWSDATALATVTAIYPTGVVNGDTVTLSNGTTFTLTKYWNGSGWIAPGTVLDGNLLVTGSVSATKINANGLSIKDTAGNVILNAGASLALSTLNFPGTVTNVPASLDNSTIAINASTGALSGIGTGSGTVVDNSKVTTTSIGAASTSDLATKLNKSAADTLSGTVTLQTGGSLLAGTTTNGVYLASTGLVGVKAGVTTFSIDSSGNAVFKGDLTGATGTFSSKVQVGSSPAVSGATMTGSGAVLNANGTFAIGNSTGNISFDGTTTTLNGNVVATANINANAVSNYWQENYQYGVSGYPFQVNIAGAFYQTTFTTITIPTAGVLAVSVSYTLHNNSTATDYSIEYWTAIAKNGIFINVFAETSWLKIMSGGSQSGSYSAHTSGMNGSMQTTKDVKHVTVAAGDTIQIRTNLRVATTQTVMWCDSVSYNAVLYKR